MSANTPETGGNTPVLKVVDLRKQAPDANTVKLLRDMLTRAESGELRAVAVCGITVENGNRSTIYEWFANAEHRWLLAWAVTLTQRRLVDAEIDLEAPLGEPDGDDE